MAPADDLHARTEVALRRYEEQVRWYDDHARTSRRLWYVFQAATVVFGVMTPVAVLLPGLPKWLQAIPAAMAALAAGLTGVFRWRENWTRFARSRELLRRERQLFDTRSTQRYGRDVDEDVVLDRFVLAVEALCASELSDWQTFQTSSGDDARNTGQQQNRA